MNDIELKLQRQREADVRHYLDMSKEELINEILIKFREVERRLDMVEDIQRNGDYDDWRK